MGSENNLILIWRPICAAMAMGDGIAGRAVLIPWRFQAVLIPRRPWRFQAVLIPRRPWRFQDWSGILRVSISLADNDSANKPMWKLVLDLVQYCIDTTLLYSLFCWFLTVVAPQLSEIGNRNDYCSKQYCITMFRSDLKRCLWPTNSAWKTTFRPRFRPKNYNSLSSLGVSASVIWLHQIPVTYFCESGENTLGKQCHQFKEKKDAQKNRQNVQKN